MSSILVIQLGHYKSNASSKFLSYIHAIFYHIYVSTRFNTPEWSFRMQVILLQVTGNFLITKLITIIETEADCNFLDKFFINKLLKPRVESAGMVFEGDFFVHKDHRSVKVALYMNILVYNKLDKKVRNNWINR